MGREAARSRRSSSRASADWPRVRALLLIRARASLLSRAMGAGAQPPAAAVPGVFAGQREAGLGEGGQVAGADGAVFVDDGVGAGVQRVERGR